MHIPICVIYSHIWSFGPYSVCGAAAFSIVFPGWEKFLDEYLCTAISLGKNSTLCVNINELFVQVHNVRRIFGEVLLDDSFEFKQ